MSKFKEREIELKKNGIPPETDEDFVFNLSLRPRNLSDFVGQKDIVSSLKIAIEAAKKRSEPLEHILLSGPPGLGKTSLAYCIAHELSSKVMATSGPAIERAGDLIGILTNLERGDILFIDEIHRLSKVVEEFLYPAMENFQIDFVIDKGPYAKSIKFNLKPFTLIGATTREGLLSAPLRGRFGLFFHFDFYSEEDLTLVIERSAKILEVKIDRPSALEIAKRARGTPRIANRLLRRVRDYSQVKEKGKIETSTVEKALSFLKIDERGLGELDRKYLKVLIEIYKGGPAGVEALSASLGEEQDTLIDIIEPYLLKIGFVKRSPRGRIATELAYRHLGIPYDKEVQQKLF
ncbi:MAG TPA: Holliday junction branch migration DNA helicase RuvB [Candidatus Omnitrophica bacterium]|nr:MAG: Holliday junction branch migration DNA helicase RuvB [Candidatus Omnitrophota bacterium]RKY35657.1 MAG: Holliday junction branch migration DNA helicase RuvB [Candidatus Omnitrophota bacterium]RKY43723.1 MAG: Holliday junction branch migration DNA helicase RuvB [Candidatus Omnitrophota bacterium]HEC69281.1 Holliday junction branch migration DNA helicase RuvB [Candidatus Omnitrophota bacterium]